jgi:outer membrane protein, adhesin transport system
MKKITLFMMLCCAQAGVQADTLVEVVRKTLETNPDVRISVSTRLTADHELTQARSGYFPSLDFQAAYGKQRSDNYTTFSRKGGAVDLNRQEASLTLSQMLFDGFDTRNESLKRAAKLDAAAWRVQESSEAFGLKAIEVFLEYFRRHELAELAKDNLVIHQKIHNQINALFDKGAGRKADVQQSESREALASSNLEYAQGFVLDAEANYLKVVGETPKNLVSPEHQLAKENLPKNIEMALALIPQHPTLKAFQSELEAAQAAHDQARAPMMPRLDLELEASKNKNLDGIDYKNDDARAMLKFRYNLFKGGVHHARMKETAERLNLAKENLIRAQRSLEEETRLAWNALQTVGKRLNYLQQQVFSAEAVTYSYKQQFRLGQRSLLDVLDSESELYNAKSALISARYTESFGFYRLLAAMGRLLPTLKIDPLPESAIATK